MIRHKQRLTLILIIDFISSHISCHYYYFHSILLTCRRVAVRLVRVRRRRCVRPTTCSAPRAALRPLAVHLAAHPPASVAVPAEELPVEVVSVVPVVAEVESAPVFVSRRRPHCSAAHPRRSRVRARHPSHRRRPHKHGGGEQIHDVSYLYFCFQ